MATNLRETLREMEASKLGGKRSFLGRKPRRFGCGSVRDIVHPRATAVTHLRMRVHGPRQSVHLGRTLNSRVFARMRECAHPVLTRCVIITVHYFRKMLDVKWRQDLVWEWILICCFVVERSWFIIEAIVRSRGVWCNDRFARFVERMLFSRVENFLDWKCDLIWAWKVSESRLSLETDIL